MNPVEVVRAHADRSVPLEVRNLDGYVLIQGDIESLHFLSELLLAVAHDPDCGFQMGFAGPGQVFFSPGSDMGIYIHRIPCTHIGPDQ